VSVSLRRQRDGVKLVVWTLRNVRRGYRCPVGVGSGSRRWCCWPLSSGVCREVLVVIRLSRLSRGNCNFLCSLCVCVCVFFCVNQDIDEFVISECHFFVNYIYTYILRKPKFYVLLLFYTVIAIARFDEGHCRQPFQK